MEKRNVAGIIVDQETADAQTLAALKEIEEISGSAHNFQTHTVTVELDGKMVELEVPVDDIDLLEDFDDEDLTEEGARSLGLISENYDSTSGNIPIRMEKARMGIGEYRIRKSVIVHPVTGEAEEILIHKITCPYTGSSNVYKISTNIFASIETEQPFYVNLDQVCEDEED